ncbi:MAG: hypothetical protein ACRDY6_13740 [Acidimicrobiia bacterium]
MKGRAGRVSSPWTPGSASRPNEEDVTEFLVQVAAEMDALIASLGHTVPATGAAAEALKGTNIDGALVLALEAQFPGGVPSELERLYNGAAKRYDRALGLLDKGKHAALALLESTPSDPSASTLWSEEPEYGQTVERESDRNVNLRPSVFRGQKL